MSLVAAIDQRYNLRGHPDRVPAYAALAQRGAVFKARMQRAGRVSVDVPYASHARARLDVFRPQVARAILVFFHGGYWRALDKTLFCALAEAFVEQGLIVVMPGYPLAPDSPIPDIVKHARLALGWVQANHDKDLPIVVSGHSAGAHLAAMTALDDSCSNRIAGSILVSGLFDLDPLRFTNVNVEAKLDASTAAKMSPALLAHDSPRDALLLVGQDETDGFKAQTTTYAARLRRAGGRVIELEPAGLNHFTILAPIAQPGAELHQQVSAFINECVKPATLHSRPSRSDRTGASHF